MSEIEVRETEELVIPVTGEVVNLRDLKACAGALSALRQADKDIAYGKAVLSRAIAEEAARRGENTIDLGGRVKIEVRSGDKTTYDAEKLVDLLRQAGMPEGRISEIVREETTMTVNAVELKKAARANARYAEALEATKTIEPGAPIVAIRRR